MESIFDVRKYLKIDQNKPIELRICHIAELWYKAVYHEKMENQLDTIYKLFPELVIKEGLSKGKLDFSPEYDIAASYITAYRKDGPLYQGSGDIEQIIRCLYGTANIESPKNITYANDIQIRISGELCEDISLIFRLRNFYSARISTLNPHQMDRFETVFKAYINTVMKDSKKYRGYKTSLFPFTSERLVFDLNNYLSNEFNNGNYADFFLWMNLGALLRNEINSLIDTYDSSFNLRGTKPSPTHARGMTGRIPKCLTRIPPVNYTVGLVGRDDVRKTVLAMLEENGRMALVSGLGGIGKTTVMRWVCNDLREEGNYVAWIDCGDSLKRDILVLGDELGIPIEEPDTAYKMILSAIKNRLDGSLYLFLDNLTEELGEEELGDLNSLGVHIMVTSRMHNDAFQEVEISALEDGPAVTMFFRYYNGDTDREYEKYAYDIVTSVNRHTLLIELLARAAKNFGGTIEDFNKKLAEQGVFDVFKRTIKMAHGRSTTIEDCVMKLYEFSSLSGSQKHIMKLFTIFAAEKEIFYKVSEWAGLDMEAMDGLIDLAWLERTGPENNFKIHQIIKDSLAAQMKKQGEELNIEEYGNLLNRVIDTHSYMPRVLEHTKVRERLVLTESVAKYLEYRTAGVLDGCTPIEDNKDVLISATWLYYNIARIFQNQGDYGKALEYYGKALVICERVLGTEHPGTATTCNGMAVVHGELGDYDKAVEYFGKVLAIRERVFGTEHPSTAMLYNDMAVVYGKLSDYDKALKYYGKALAICERVSGTEHPSTATTYNNMACVYEELGDYDKALEYFGKALAICERVLGTEHPLTATLYNSMADVYEDQGDFNKALGYYGKALAIRERVLGTEHPSTATTYHNMAVVNEELGDYDEALEYYGKALTVRERVLGTEHPDTATTYNSMASVYTYQGDYDKAQEYNEKALAIRERVLGMEHPSTATTYNYMADMYEDQGDYDKALGYYGKALAIRERVLGTEHPDTATTYNNMACVYEDQGDYDKALGYYGKALAICERVLGTEHPSTATLYNNMAYVYGELGDYDKALEYNGKLLGIRERVLGTEHPLTAKTYNNMAYVYGELGDYDKALEYYGKALGIRERVLGIEHPSTATTYNNIASVYTYQGDYDKALEYFGKTLAIRERVSGTEHPSTATTYNNMASVYTYQGDYDKAQEYNGKALAIFERVLGTEHPSTAKMYINIAVVYRNQGDYTKALDYYKKALTIREKKFGANHPDTKAILYAIEKTKDICK